MVAQTHERNLRALVVDDDPIVRKILNASLSSEGFECQMAADGQQALDYLKASEFDLLVTDLRMPEKNGHALSVDVLEQTQRPVIIVHSGVRDPRIARDLILRGVDDVVPKPTDYSALAAKAWGLVTRRRTIDTPHSLASTQATETASHHETVGAEPANSTSSATDHEQVRSRLSSREIQTRLSQLKSLVPLSDAAFDVYSLATNDAEVDSLREAIERDATLAAEVLKLANSAYCGAGNRRIDSIDDAIIRLGRQSMGELALVVSVRQGLSSHSVPWIDRKQLWCRSVAAGIAAQQLSKLSGDGSQDDRQLQNALHLSALLFPVGRLALAALFPDEHQALVEQCQATGDSLDDAEKQQFGLTHFQVAARLMSVWNLPRETRTMLEHASRPFNRVPALNGKLQDSVERLKLAILIGQIATADWHLCDTVDVPNQQVLMRAGVDSLDRLVSDVRTQLGSRISTASGDDTEALTLNGIGPVVYRSPEPEHNDTLRILLKLAGATLLHSASPAARVALVNGVSSTPQQVSAVCAMEDARNIRVIGSDETADKSDTATHIRLPASLQTILA